jgi:hypothetical protein
VPKPKNKAPGHSHSMQTPPYALEPLYEYLRKDWTIWECASGKGYLVDALLKKGYKVKWSDIERDLKEDFFTFTPKQGFDCIITNPPYDIKDRWLERCYELGKPFALLLPIDALSTPGRQSLFRRYGLEIILSDHRYSFETPNGGQSAWFDTCWFTWQLHIGAQITYYEYDKDEWAETSKAWKSHLATTGKPKGK